MLAYAADRRPAARPHPKTLALIVAGHAGLLFAVMTARGDLVVRPPFEKTEITLIDPVKDLPPPPPPETHPVKPQKTISTLTQTDPVVKIETPSSVGPVDTGPSIPDSGNGTSTVPIPEPIPAVLPPPALVAARSLTGAGDLIPPYPDDKLREGREANIQLRLSIDASGRVTAVAPVGNADTSFLSAARRHILKRWKYAPATRGGTPVASSQVVTIRFRLDG